MKGIFPQQVMFFDDHGRGSPHEDGNTSPSSVLCVARAHIYPWTVRVVSRGQVGRRAGPRVDGTRLERPGDARVARQRAVELAA